MVIVILDWHLHPWIGLDLWGRSPSSWLSLCGHKVAVIKYHVCFLFFLFFKIEFSEHFIINIFKHKAKLKEFCHQDPYIYHLDSTINILLYLLYYILICSSLYPSINAFYCLCWEENFSSLGPVVGCLQIDNRQTNRRKDKVYSRMRVGVLMSNLLKTRNKRLKY